MTRKIVRAKELPLLEIVYEPTIMQPLVVTLYSDFELTGEVHCTQDATDEQLRSLKQRLELITNAIADTLWERLQSEEVPFKPTGKVKDILHPSE